LELLRDALAKAGNTMLLTAELMDTLINYSVGNYPLLMIGGVELRAYGMAQDVAQLVGVHRYSYGEIAASDLG
jgi:hypothetical protein